MPLNVSAPQLSPHLGEFDDAVLTDPNNNQIPCVALVHPSVVDGSNEIGATAIQAGVVSQVTGKRGRPMITIGGKQMPVLAVFDLTANAAAFKKSGGKFQSAVRTATGAAEAIAHGLGVVPSIVLAAVQDNTGVATVVIAEGVHDATNINITVTANAKYKVIALA